MKSKKIKIGIIGLGYVGDAIRYWFKEKRKPRVSLFLYDKYKQIGSVDEVNLADIIFICVPTPYHEDGAGHDDSAVVESLKNLKPGKIAVIKSTILPGSTEKFQKDFAHLIIVFNPEFLRAKMAKKDFVRPNLQIVGYTTKSKRVARRVLFLLPSAPYSAVIPATEAELVKYFVNAFLATRVVFANQMYDLCSRLKINYDAVKHATGADPRIGYSHFDIFQDGYRGYGGLCLPKDTKSLIDFAKKLKVNLKLLRQVEEINNFLRKANGRSNC